MLVRSNYDTKNGPLPPRPPAVLENRHIACLYSLLLCKPHLNIFGRLDATQWKEVRALHTSNFATAASML